MCAGACVSVCIYLLENSTSIGNDIIRSRVFSFNFVSDKVLKPLSAAIPAPPPSLYFYNGAMVLNMVLWSWSPKSSETFK